MNSGHRPSGPDDVSDKTAIAKATMPTRMSSPRLTHLLGLSVVILAVASLVQASWFSSLTGNLKRAANLSNASSNKRSNISVLPDLYEAGVLEIQSGLDAGHFTSVDLVKVRSLLACSRASYSAEIFEGLPTKDRRS
jgi:hypothetical protein